MKWQIILWRQGILIGCNVRVAREEEKDLGKIPLDVHKWRSQNSVYAKSMPGLAADCTVMAWRGERTSDPSLYTTVLFRTIYYPPHRSRRLPPSCFSSLCFISVPFPPASHPRPFILALSDDTRRTALLPRRDVVVSPHSFIPPFLHSLILLDTTCEIVYTEQRNLRSRNRMIQQHPSEFLPFHVLLLYSSTPLYHQHFAIYRLSDASYSRIF